MNLCPYCYNEAGGIGAGDECLDYCHECDKVIEGNTITEDDLQEEQNKEFQAWVAAIDADQDYINEEVKWQT